MDIMSSYEKLTEFLGNVLSDNYEVALLDLRKDHNCITAIANGHTSGRSVGAPITDLALGIIKDDKWKTTDYLLNYSGLSRDKRPLVSSSFFIKENGKLLGMFCINVDTKIYCDLSDAILKLGKLSPINATVQVEVPSECTENFANDINEMINVALSNITNKNSIPPSRLTKEEKIELVSKLNDNGIFLIKGAVTEVADRLDCSEATIYRYLSKLNKRQIL